MRVVVHVVGARPNFIKAAPLIKCMEKGDFQNILVHTGQHYDRNMSQQFFEELNIPNADFDLNASRGSHAVQTANIMIGYERNNEDYNHKPLNSEFYVMDSNEAYEFLVTKGVLQWLSI